MSLLTEPRPGRRFGMWNIAQVRAPGEILIPVSSTDCIANYARPPEGRDCVQLVNGLIRFNVGESFKQKIGVKADSVLGKLGFLRKCDDGMWSLIVRNFLVDPSGEYVDAPWDDESDLGYAVQCYNDDGKFGDFGFRCLAKPKAP